MRTKDIKENETGLFHIVGSHTLVLPIDVEMERSVCVHSHSYVTSLGKVHQLLSHTGIGL